MQIGPLFLTLVICLWLYLAALAWALSAAIRRAEPRFSALAIGMALSALTVALTIAIGRQSVPGLVLSFPACFGVILIVGLFLQRLPGTLLHPRNTPHELRTR